MEKKKGFLASRGESGWMLLVAALLGVLELVLYLKEGRTTFDPNYSWYAIAGMGIGIACGLIGFLGRIRLFAFLSYLCFLYGFVHYIVSQINLIANILYGVDGSTFSPVFFVTLGAAFVTFVLALISGILMKNRRGAAQA